MRVQKLARLLCLGALAAAAGGCAVADTGAFVRLQEDMATLKKEGAAARATRAAAPAAPSSPARVETGEISSLQRNVADLTANYDQVKSDLVAATTRADETKVQLQKEIAQLSEKTARVEEINRRVVTLEGEMEKVAAASLASSAAPAPVPPDWKNAEEMYDYSLGLIKGGETPKGRETLTEFAAPDPDHT